MLVKSLLPLADGRTRYVCRLWQRDPNGPVLKKPPPKGIRTPNGIIWGHDLMDFFWLERIPGSNVLTIWSRSMIKELGENYDEDEFEEMDYRQFPRPRYPWPVLKFPQELAKLAPSQLGVIDQDCLFHFYPAYIPQYRPEKPEEEVVDKEFDKLIKRLFGVENEGVFVRNDPKAPLKSPDGRIYTLLWAPNHRKSHALMTKGIPVPPQPIQPHPFTFAQMDHIGWHVLTALDEDALEQLGGPSLPPPENQQEANAASSSKTAPSNQRTDNTSSTHAGADVTMAETSNLRVALDTSGGNAKVDVDMLDGDQMVEHAPAEATAPTVSGNDNKSETEPSDIDMESQDRKVEPTKLDKCLSRGDIPRDSPFSVDEIPKLEEFLPVDYFPDYLHVHDPHSVTFATDQSYGYRATTSLETKTLVYKRVFPKLSRDNEKGEDTNPEVKPKIRAPTRVAHLHLAQQNRFGVGHHSLVHHAPLTLPEPLTAHSRNGRVTVAAKSAFRVRSARTLLHNEAKMYNAFPRHLSEDWCGFNLVTPMKHPVPIGPVVPKFYGYYVPVRIEDGKEVLCDEIDPSSNSALLLIEECGKPVEPAKFTADMRSECYSMMCRLHYAGFVQGSFFVRNILVQRGPLTLPPEKRSKKTPSFRLIDFGRGEEFGVVDGDPNDKDRVEKQKGRWGNMVFEEDNMAQRELQIGMFHL